MYILFIMLEITKCTVNLYLELLAAASRRTALVATTHCKANSSCTLLIVLGLFWSKQNF